MARFCDNLVMQPESEVKKVYKKLVKYMSTHATYNAGVHLMIGMGIGILAAWPVFLPHPVRWGVGLIALGLLGHLYPLVVKK